MNRNFHCHMEQNQTKTLMDSPILPSDLLLVLSISFPHSSVGQESACNVRPGSIPGLGRSPGEEKDYSLQYSGLENSMDCIDHGVAKSQTRLSNFHLLHSLTHSIS